MSANVTITDIQILSDEKYTLKKVYFAKVNEEGKQQVKAQEVYDPGDAATILLYNAKKKTVILTKQFRLPAYLNKNSTGMLIETCAGKLNKGESPEESIRRESEEETGYKVGEIKMIFRAYMSAGSLSELVYFFTAPYTEENKISEGGGLEEEQEDIEILEIDFNHALAMIDTNEIEDAKTIMLLQYASMHQYYKV